LLAYLQSVDSTIFRWKMTRWRNFKIDATIFNRYRYARTLAVNCSFNFKNKYKDRIFEKLDWNWT
jgi:hypothetical protein